MKTKFVKVSVEERLPEKEGWYYTSNKEDDYQVWKWKKGYRWEGIEHWLEEIPDREAEMLDMLQMINNIENGAFGLKSFNIEDLKRKIQRLIEATTLK